MTAVLPLLPSALVAQAPATGPVRGPFWSGTVMRGKGVAAAMKGLAINLGADKRSHVVYDLDTLRLSVAWTGEFLEFGNTLTKIEWPPPPSMKGTNLVFETAMGPGWSDVGGSIQDPRKDHQGPLPKAWAHYEGLYLHGDHVVLKYSVGGVEVLESPSLEGSADKPVIVRTIQPTGALRGGQIVIASAPAGAVASKAGNNSLVLRDAAKGTSLAISVDPEVQGALQVRDGQVVFKIGRAHV